MSIDAWKTHATEPFERKEGFIGAEPRSKTLSLLLKPKGFCTRTTSAVFFTANFTAQRLTRFVDWLNYAHESPVIHGFVTLFSTLTVSVPVISFISHFSPEHIRWRIFFATSFFGSLCSALRGIFIGKMYVVFKRNKSLIARCCYDLYWNEKYLNAIQCNSVWNLVRFCKL